MGHLPFLGFRCLLKDMASCIDTQRSLALDWIMDMQLEVQRLLVRLQFFHCSNYPLFEKNSCNLISLMSAQNENNSTVKIFQITVVLDIFAGIKNCI